MNQDETREDDVVTAVLTDLPLLSAQAEETKAGFGGVMLVGPPASEKGLEKFGPGGLVYSGESGGINDGY